ncbi:MULTISPECIES: YfiR family protein [unclassified Endozoicomonas]|uniref:YfiR family protein n=1 Tax=unclassified Endozoicomonas TaxID=2644528 RepID=UPI0021475F60|nr:MULTISPECIES: YfiR family protein [unclassified Endozoicomonas]
MPMPINMIKSKISLLLITASLSGMFFTSAAKAGTPEDMVKTAIVYKITKFVTWPKKKQSLTLCIMGEGSINSELTKINRKSSMGRRLSVTHKDLNAPVDKLCDILYIHSIDQASSSKMTRSLKGKPILTISDSRSFAEQGGLIGLARKGKKISFTINKSSVDASGLKISSQLKSLAKVIE